MATIIRTPTSARGGITEKERAQMEEHTKMWIANALSTEPVDEGALVPAVKRLYVAAGLSEPRVVIVPSPAAMAFAGGFAAGLWYLRKHGLARAATYDATYDATNADTLAATYDAT